MIQDPGLDQGGETKHFIKENSNRKLISWRIFFHDTGTVPTYLLVPYLRCLYLLFRSIFGTVLFFLFIDVFSIPSYYEALDSQHYFYNTGIFDGMIGTVTTVPVP